MAVLFHDDEGKPIVVFADHDPDKLDEGLALELAEERARDAVIEAARKLLDMAAARMGWWDREAEGLWRAVRAYDAAVAANRAHDDSIVLYCDDEEE